MPSVEIVGRSTAATLIRQRESDDLVAVSQNFEGAFNGRALLIFPQANSMALVRAVAGQSLDDDEASELENEALAETGNVVLNGCLATMANMLRLPLTMSLPLVIRGPGHALFETTEMEDGSEGVVMFIYINFSVMDRDIRGYIAMLMDMPSLTNLRGLIASFIARVLDPGPAGTPAAS